MTSSRAFDQGAGSVPLFGPASGPFDIAEAVLDATPVRLAGAGPATSLDNARPAITLDGAGPALSLAGAVLDATIAADPAPASAPASPVDLDPGVAERAAAAPLLIVSAPQQEGIREQQARQSLDPSAMIDHRSRIVAYSDDRVSWIRARSRGITATDVAKLTSESAVRSVLWEKLNGSGFGGNAYTEHGRRREPVIARWVFDEHGIAASNALFHAFEAPQHLATPDGVVARSGGTVELAEIKTTSKPWRSIPRGYLRQIWWQQYVLGAERTLLVWEQHKDFRIVDEVPQCRWIERDDAQISTLISYAEMVLDGLEVARSRGY